MAFLFQIRALGRVFGDYTKEAGTTEQWSSVQFVRGKSLVGRPGFKKSKKKL